MAKYTLYLLYKFNGNIDLAIAVQRNRCELAFLEGKNIEWVLRECEVFQYLEVLKASK